MKRIVARRVPVPPGRLKRTVTSPPVRVETVRWVTRWPARVSVTVRRPALGAQAVTVTVCARTVGRTTLCARHAAPPLTQMGWRPPRRIRRSCRGAGNSDDVDVAATIENELTAVGREARQPVMGSGGENTRLPAACDVIEDDRAGAGVLLDAGERATASSRPSGDRAGADRSLTGSRARSSATESKPTEISALDAARFLAWNARDNLGWRILMEVDPPGDANEMRRVLGDGRELVEALPCAYVERHQPMIDLAHRLATGQLGDDGDVAGLAGILGCDLDDLSILRLADEDRGLEDEEVEIDRSAPSIICTSFVGAKGLSAGNVFVAGLVNGEFPRDAAAITDKEVCEFIVALSRTRQRCSSPSNRRFATRAASGRVHSSRGFGLTLNLGQ